MKIKYIANCGLSFDTKEKALKHEAQHKISDEIMKNLNYSEKEAIKKVQDTLFPIFGDKLPEFCNELADCIDEYSKDKGLSKDSLFDAKDFMRWLEAKHYDWMPS